jgi:acetylornithine deacetylase/succinyl-diaminopimelate desuccinylase-like protein
MHPSMIKRVLFVLLGLVLLLVAAVAINTFRQGSRQLDVPPAPPLAIDNNAVADKLAGMIRFRTIPSLEDGAQNIGEFRKLHAYLEQRFPLVHAKLKREFVGELSLLYTWQGSDASAKPIALMAHHDVAPIASGTEASWQVPPFDGVAAPAALIGVAEKGYVSVNLKLATAPGHSSMPPPAGTGAIAQMGAALQRLDQEQFPAELKGVARELFSTLAPEMTGFQRVALSNLWLFGPAVEKQLAKGPSTNAMLRTTTALTILNAGNKENVIPGSAEATVNFRILPGETQQTVLEHVRSKVGPNIQLTTMPGGVDPTPITSTNSPSYQVMARTLRSIFPGTVVAPALYIAASDSQHFVPIADSIYRFSPVRAKPEDLPRLHGTNERISVANLGELVRFYHQLLRNLNAPAP